MNETATRAVPAAALQFASEISLSDNGESAKSAPISLVARSSKPTDHPYWGRCVHDFAGMSVHKPRLPIDYCHDQKEVIGYANKFDSSSGDLVASGALVPYRGSDRATEIIHKSKMGIPYEASVRFCQDGLVVEEVPEFAITQVNGTQFAGPGVVFRKWSLRGIAVCPYGQDMHTSSNFSESAAGATVTIITAKESHMTNETAAEAVATEQPAVEATTTETATEAAPEAAVEVATEAPAEAAQEAPAVEANPVEMSAPAPGQQFLDAFGEQGGVWFAQGKSFDECRTLFTASLQEKLSAVTSERDRFCAELHVMRGESEPVSFSAPQASDQDSALYKLTAAFGGDEARAKRVLELRAKQRK